MANLISTFRAALAADLAVQFPNADVVQGSRSGKAVERDKVAVMWGGSTERGAAVVVGNASFLVRYWPASPKLADDSTSGVRDPGPLEQAAFDLQDFLQTKQTAYDSVWFFRLVRVTPDYDPEEWGVEAELLLEFDNPAVI